MIETANLIQTEKDRYDTPGIKTVSEFENHCMIEGEKYKIRIAVKHQANRRFVYYYGAVKISIKKTVIMGIPASPFGCTDLNITAFGYRLFIISHKFRGLSIKS